MPRCDLCGVIHETVETLGFKNPDIAEDFWRTARVCERCRNTKLMPTLRLLFQDGALNLNPAEDADAWETITPNSRNALFFAFEGTDSWHVARRAMRAVPIPDEWRCVGHCGIEHHVEPEPRQRPLSARREGITVCARCATFASMYVGAEP